LATIRAGYVERELAAKRAPDVRGEHETTVPTLAEVAQRWQVSRFDVAAETATQHRAALNRVLPTVGRSRVDDITPADVRSQSRRSPATARRASPSARASPRLRWCSTSLASRRTRRATG
jgi:hypothetical protein